jgi:hypothetical protein
MYVYIYNTYITQNIDNWFFVLSFAGYLRFAIFKLYQEALSWA